MTDSLGVSADSSVWHVGGIGRIVLPLDTMETLTLFYVIVTTLIFLGTVGALIYSARNLKEAVAARSEQARAVFETTFFHLVSLHHEIVRDVWVIQRDYKRKRPEDRRPLEGEFDVTEQRVEGRAAFLTMYGRLKGAYEEQKRENAESVELERIRAAYETFFQQYGNRVGHLFRNLYNTVKYVDRAAPRDKQLYLNILRAQLSSTELLLLFYNCLTEHGSPKFKALVERYALLERMPLHELIDRAQHEGLYQASAYQENFEDAG